MPNKTKKEKIIAAYRRKLKAINNQSVFSASYNQPNDKIMTDITKIPALSQQSITLTDEDKKITAYFKIDLNKSLILIFFIIALEIFLYFATMKQYLKLF